MDNVSTQSDNSANNHKSERRSGERRFKQRRNVSDNARHYNGVERRSVDSDRRTTIVNRLNIEVTDRRSLN